ncbi:MAG: hypothetical protein QXT73_02245 [Candidatus Methanomethylicaceae archaeon]
MNSGGLNLPFWIPIPPHSISFYNPWIPKVFAQRTDWATCALLSPGGMCMDYSERPAACRVSPNLDLFLFEYLEGLADFYCPWCYYRRFILDLKEIPYTTLPSGILCARKYLQKIKQDHKLAEAYVGNTFLQELALLE